MGSECGQDRASRHLIAEARQQAREYDGRECVHRNFPDQAHVFLARHALRDKANFECLAL